MRFCETLRARRNFTWSKREFMNLLATLTGTMGVDITQKNSDGLISLQAALETGVLAKSPLGIYVLMYLLIKRF